MSSVSLTSLVECLWVRPVAYQSGVPERSYAYTTLFTYIKVSRRDMSGRNTLAYHENLEIMAVKGFLTFGPGSNVIKLFMFVIYELSQ